MKRTWKAEYNIENLDKAVAELKSYITELEETVTQQNGAIQKFIPYPQFEMPRATGWYSSEPSFETKHKALDEWFEKCKTIRDQNTPVEANNRDVLAASIRYMKSLGLSETQYKEVKRGKRCEVIADWKLSLDSQIPTVSAWWNCERLYKQTSESLKRAETARLEELRKEQIAEEKLKQQKSVERATWELTSRYGLGEEATLDDVLNLILEKDKYLRLAHYLLKNREDWNDGPDLAERGLSGFTAETPEDRDIEKEIRRHIDDWQGDGRIFRDCEFNYGWLFNKAQELDAALFADYEKVSNLISEAE